MTTAVQAAIVSETGLTTELSTSGGTSDGRFISPDQPGGRVEVVELGINATIHKVNECVAVADLESLAWIYAASSSVWCQQGQSRRVAK